MDNIVKHCSASSITTFKRCPEQYRLAYVEGLRESIEPETFRMGHAWHTGLEVLAAPIGTVFPSSVSKLGGKGTEEFITTEENHLNTAIFLAIETYSTIPDWADPTDWAVEREIIANLLAGYHWYHQQDDYEIVATETPFELPLVNPETGRPTPNMVRVGKIDRIVRNKRTGAILIGENKTTSRAIDSGSTYWARLRMDTQSRYYICAARDMQERGEIHAPDGTTFRGESLLWNLMFKSPVTGLLHDVVRKPTIRPSKLTMAESAEFVKTGEYCGQQFEAEVVVIGCDGLEHLTDVRVDGVMAKTEPGKKEGTFALRETPGMFGARLLQDITQRPEYYFARREIAFTDVELGDFRQQVWYLQKNMNEMERTGRWFQNELQCESTFKCRYCPICYNNVDVSTAIPPGFKRLSRIEALRAEVGVLE